MKLSIIIPVYNEEKTIKKILDKVFSVKLSCEKEIIVVDDGSTDGTKERIKNLEFRIKNSSSIILKAGDAREEKFCGEASFSSTPTCLTPMLHRGSLGGAQKNSCRPQQNYLSVKVRKLRYKHQEDPQIKIIFHKQNLGKGAAIQTGIKHATGDYILIQDADLEYNPAEIPKLLSPLSSSPPSPSYPPYPSLPASSLIAVYGSRFMKNQAVIPSLYLLGNKFLTLLTNLLYGTKLTDMETGYKLLPSSFVKKINFQSKRFDIEPEITVKLVQAKIPIIEVPISYKGRTHLAGKKLTVKDAWGAIKTLVLERIRL